MTVSQEDLAKRLQSALNRSLEPRAITESSTPGGYNRAYHLLAREVKAVIEELKNGRERDPGQA